MSIFLKHWAKDLPDWLAIATTELVAAAKKRVMLEIEAHYTDTVAAHLADGLSESDARKAALAELGSPAEASIRFRKQHLTECNAKDVRGGLRRVGSYWWLLSAYFMFLILFMMGTQGIFNMPSHRDLVVTIALSFYIFVVAPTTGFVMVRRKTKKIGFVFLFRFSVGILIGSYLVFFGRDHYIGILCCFPIICAWLYELRIWLKLRHVANIWDEIPSLKE